MRIQHNLKPVPYQATQLRPEAAPLPLNITPEMIASAIEARTIVPVFQPVVDMKTGETVSCEVLSRWNHDDHGVIVPGAFIACAEAAGLLDPLMMSLLDPISDVIAKSNATLSFAINISPSQLSDPWFAPRFLSQLIRARIPPHRLTIEITETVLIEDFAAVGTTIRSLKAQGLRIALDDFGTGYSNLSYICELDIDSIKLDRKFVCSLAENSTTEKIVQAIVGLSSGIGATVVAEGIETKCLARHLTELGCHHGQGFLYARPMAGSEFIASSFAPEGHPALATCL